jgi:hypothetical protein
LYDCTECRLLLWSLTANVLHTQMLGTDDKVILKEVLVSEGSIAT